MKILPCAAMLAALLVQPPLATAAEPVDAEPVDADGLKAKRIPIPSTTRGGGPRLGLNPVRGRLDVEKVAALVSARLEEARDEALRDLFADLTDDVDIAPIRDIAETLPLLLSPGHDAHGRSQIVEALVVRVAVSAALATAFIAPEPPKSPEGEAIGASAHRLYTWDAVYEGIARSTLSDSMGFPAADGTVAEAGYSAGAADAYTGLATRITRLIDTLAVPQSVLAAAAKGRSAGAMVDALRVACLPRFEAKLGAAGERLAAAQAAVDAASPGSEAELTAAKAALAAAQRTRDAVAGLGDAMTLATLDEAATAIWSGHDANWQAGRQDDDPCSVAYGDVLSLTRTNLDTGLTVKALGEVVSALVELAPPAGDGEQTGPLADAVTVWLPRLLLVQRVLADGLDRDAVYALSAIVIEEVERLEMHDALAAGIIAVFEELPLAVGETYDTNGRVTGITLDTTVLADGLIRRYEQADRPGFYFRATVGTGYWSVVTGKESTGLVPAVYEELGVGWRHPLWNDRVLFGPHLAVSGLLHRAVLDDEVQDAVLAIAGASVQLYGVIDLSLGAGWAVHAASDEQKGALLVLGGLQVSLVDYLTADDDP